LTKSPPEGIRIKSSAEAAINPETRCSSMELAAGHATLCTNSQVGNTIEVHDQPELPKSASKEDKPVTSNVTRRANNASKKARQRATMYGPKKLLLAKTITEKQDTFEKDPTDSMQLPAVPSIVTKSSAEAESPLRRHQMLLHSKATSLRSSAAEAAPQSSAA
jgi:hypothetical protein